MLLTIEHSTLYRYASSVRFGPHHGLVYPIEGPATKTRSFRMESRPTAAMRWQRDPFNNVKAAFEFEGEASELSIQIRIEVERRHSNPFDFILEPMAAELPAAYSEGLRKELAAYIEPEFPEDDAVVREWLRPFLDRNGRAETLALLTAFNRSTLRAFTYARREEPGVQSPATTLQLRTGSCRDFAVLFMEGARRLGLAARFVSGYLCQANTDRSQAASGATHAWAEVYLEGGGWKGFDPTCGMMAADFHVAAAVARSASQAPPLAGSFIGPPSAYRGMEVTVHTSFVN